MLIFSVLCLAAILPTGFSDPLLEPPQMSKNDELAHRYAAAAAAAAARNLGMYAPSGQTGENDPNQENIIPPPGSYVDGRGNEIYFGGEPEFRTFWVFFPAIMSAVSTVYRLIRNHQKNIDFLSNLSEMPKDPVIDSIGGGHLLKRAMALDPIGGGHLLKRVPIIDQIGGGHLLKRGNGFKEIFTSGNSLKRRPVLDSIGGGHLLKRIAEGKHSYLAEREDVLERKTEDDL